VLSANELTGLLPDTGYPVLAAPLTDQTRGMVNAELLTALPPTAQLINVGRGSLVIEDDLIAALRAGRLAGWPARRWTCARPNPCRPARRCGRLPLR
jgi:phosphoglycerate dehydrogenase-like enzyme